MQNYNDLLQRFKHAIFDADEVYSEESKNIKINIAQLGILYILNNEEPLSQKEIAEKLFSPLSTINTIIKKWEKKGLVKLIPIEGKKREKNVFLTEEGLEIKRTIKESLYKAEEDALNKTIEKYSIEFIEALEYYLDCLKLSLKNLK